MHICKHHDLRLIIELGQFVLVMYSIQCLLYIYSLV